jgi:hypothetical protein
MKAGAIASFTGIGHAALVQQRVQAAQVARGVAHGGQPRGLDLERAAHLELVAQAGQAHLLQAGRGVEARAHIGARTLAHFEQAARHQRLDRLAHRAAAHAQQLRELRLDGNARADRPAPGGDFGPDAVGGGVCQGGAGSLGKHRSRAYSFNDWTNSAAIKRSGPGVRWLPVRWRHSGALPCSRDCASQFQT